MTLGMLTHGLNNALNMMKNSSYSIIPIHQRPDLFDECCRIINAEWPASENRRLRTFSESCDEFPTSLVMLKGEKVLGHCKMSLLPNDLESCFLGSVVIDYAWRSKGLGTKLLHGAEEYAAKKGVKNMYLTTKGQEGFYLKNGYNICAPVNLWNYMIVPSGISATKTINNNNESKQFSGPPPPPMPKPAFNVTSTLTSTKTYMVKRL